MPSTTISPGYVLAGFGEHLERTVSRLLEPGHLGIELDADAVLFHVAFNVARHFRIERGHDLRPASGAASHPARGGSGFQPSPDR